ncbi:hypothetical protein EWM64_g9436 [Hericium alpestre]|uniref:Dienelactone hydrolase domain-containing protein n=1 Tax=Hericium alpestre TaxID=135208 RepID=A0A4Y9ZII9_9AGAM|nr:hypothetical protein EWM64_g9436 [Hericium alpestre]
MSFCPQCVQGVRHEGTPEGKFETIGGVKTYIALPTTDYPKDKAILFLTDVFGLDLPNNLLLADDYARNGFQVYAPDLFDGDPVPADRLGPNVRFPSSSPNSDVHTHLDMTQGDFDMTKWRPKHGIDASQPVVEAVVAALKAQGVARLGAIGFCYGARHVFDLAFEHEIHVAVGNHPSLLQLEDFDTYAQKAVAPLLLNTCEVDAQFPPEKQAKADAVLGGGKFAPGYERKYFAGCSHGWSVRGDMSDPVVKAAKEEAFKGSVEWFIKHL